MSVEELAAELGLSVNTIYDWNRKGTGPARHRFGRRVRYRRSDVERWAADHLVAA